jgi:hypothetical protein
MTKFVLISGKKQNGKNYFAEVMEEVLGSRGLHVVETAFAAPIKNFCNDVFGVSLDTLATEEGKSQLSHIKWSYINEDIMLDLGKDPNDYMTWREILQVIGTDVWRTRFYGPIWAEAPFRRQYDADVVLITDCRFPNELEEGLKHDAVLVRVDGGQPSTDNHASETALDDYPWKDDELFEHNFEGTDPIVDFINEHVLVKLGL